MKYYLLLLVLVLGLAFAFLPVKFLINFANDDSFFYLKTAYNFSIGEGSTFDLVNETNGYHPLWFIVLLIYFLVLNLFTTFSPELYYRFVIFLDYAICTSILFLIYKICKLIYPLFAFRFVILFSTLFLIFVFTRDFGLETHIICLLITIYLLLKSIELTSNKNLIIYKSFLLAMLFLARIDFLFSLIPLIIISDFLTTSSPIRKKFLGTSILFVTAIAIFYFISNYIFFGNFLNISGAIKSSFPESLFLKNISDLTLPGYLTNQFAKIIFSLIVILIFVILVLSNKFKNKFNKLDKLLFGICIGAVSFLLFNLVFNKHSLKEWYVAFPAFVSSILLVRILVLFPRYFYLSLIIFFAAFIFYFYLTRIENSKWDNVYDYAIELKKNTSVDERIFQIDICGIVGYFSERKVINGDGLINSFEYQKYLKSNNLGEYFKNKNITYYSTHSTDNGHYKMTDSSGYLIDSYYSNKFGGYPFKFPEENLKLKFPFYYFHAVNKDTGYWYLFKIRD